MMRSQWSMDQFQLHKQVYEGRTSRLFFATDKQSGMPVALKLYRKRKLTALNRIQVEREINIHIGITHENIIKLYAAFEDNKNVYLVLEVAEGGDLFHQVKAATRQQYSERKAVQQVIVPFLTAIKHLHNQGIVHRDIKPENILLTSDGVLKLADFGLAIDICEERPVTRLGTLDYMAPEVLLCPDKKLPEENKDRKDLTYTCQVDIWALGVLAYEVLLGYAPFEKSSRLETYEHILKRDPQYPHHISEEARSFIKAALMKDPKMRPSADMLMDHPWIKTHSHTSKTISSDTCVLVSSSSSCSSSSSSSSNSSVSSKQHQAEQPKLTIIPMPWSQWADLHVTIQQDAAAGSKHRFSGHSATTAGFGSIPNSNFSQCLSTGLAELTSSPKALCSEPNGPLRQRSVPAPLQNANPKDSSSSGPCSGPCAQSAAFLDSAPSSEQPQPRAFIALPRLSQRALPPIRAPRSAGLAVEDSGTKMRETGSPPSQPPTMTPFPRVASQPSMCLELSTPSSPSMLPHSPCKPSGRHHLGMDLEALLSPKQRRAAAADSAVTRSSINLRVAEGAPNAHDKCGSYSCALPLSICSSSPKTQQLAKRMLQRSDTLESNSSSSFGPMAGTEMFIHMQPKMDSEPSSPSCRRHPSCTFMPHPDPKTLSWVGGLSSPHSGPITTTGTAVTEDQKPLSRVDSSPQLHGMMRPRPAACKLSPSISLGMPTLRTMQSVSASSTNESGRHDHLED